MGEYNRADLKVDRVYHLQGTPTHFLSPDGRGLIWFENETQALEETGTDQPIITVDSLPVDL